MAERAAYRMTFLRRRVRPWPVVAGVLWLVVVGVALALVRPGQAAPSGTDAPAAPAVARSGADPPSGVTALPHRSGAPSPTPPARTPVTESGPDAAGVAEPVRLVVPRIGVDSRLLRLGLARDGEVEVPRSPYLAGWYDGGPAPGDVGPAVLLGHVDSQSGPGVFFRLRQLRAGDAVAVTGRDGATRRFVVTAVERYPKDRFPSERVYGPTPFRQLRLVTCGGAFDRSRGHYRDNIVAFAKMVDRGAS